MSLPSLQSAVCQLLLVVAFAVTAAFGQSLDSGTVLGRVIDSASRSPLPGANLSLAGTDIGGVSDRDGRFEIRQIPSGSYQLITTYIGTQPDTTAVDVRVDETSRVEIRLTQTALSIEGMLVEGNREGQARALNLQQTADNISNVIAAELIGRFPDPNIAEALQRVPGLSVFRDQGEGRYVLIRGSEPRLTAVSIDGVETPAPDGQFRFVALDVIPSDQFAYIEVDKTLTPEMDADGIGGAINLVTRSAVDGGRSEITLGLGRNQLASDGIRQGSFSWGDRYGADRELGIRVGGSFHRTDRGTNANEPLYGLVDLGGGPIVVLADLKLRDYRIQRRRMSLTGNFDYQVREGSSLFLRTIYSRFTDWELRRQLRYRFDKGTPVSTTAVVGGRVERELKDRYEAQDIYSALLGGEHRISADTWLDFRLSYAYAAEEEPDRRDVTFRLDGVDMEYDITDTDFPVIAADPDVGVFDESAYGIDELVSENNETTDKALSARLDVSQARTFGTFRSELKTGVKARFKSKDRRKDIGVYQWAGDDLRLAQVAGDFEDDQFLDDRYRFGLSPGPQEVEELFAAERDSLFVENSVASRIESDPNNYDASEDTYAAYAQAKTGVGRWMAVVGGRYELTSIEYESNEVLFDDDGRYEGTNSTSGDNDYGRFFPAAHLRYQLDDSTNLRVAWTNALSRPDYYDLAPYSVVSRNDEEIIRGNPALDPTTAVNFDFLAERYLNSVGIVSVAFFYGSSGESVGERGFCGDGHRGDQG